MELTREQLEMLASGDMTYNELRDKYTTVSCIPIRKIAQMLLAEMDKPNLWKDAPIDACHMRGFFEDKDDKLVSTFAYHRTPPKTRIDEIAEETCTSILMRSAPTNDFIESTVKKALLKYKAELEAGR